MNQLIKFNPTAGGKIPNMCLANVCAGFGIANKYASAWEAWEHTQQHTDLIPEGLDVPVFFSYSATIDGVDKNWGHIGVRLSSGSFWSDGNVYASIDEYMVNHWPKYVGWGESINDIKVIEGEQNMSTPLAPNLVNDLYGAYTGHQPTEADHANWDGKPVEELMAALANTPDTINYNALKAHNAEEAAKVPALEAEITALKGELAKPPATPTPVTNPVTPITPPAFPEIHVEQKSLLQIISDFLSKIFIGTKKG